MGEVRQSDFKNKAQVLQIIGCNEWLTDLSIHGKLSLFFGSYVRLSIFYLLMSIRLILIKLCAKLQFSNIIFIVVNWVRHLLKFSWSTSTTFLHRFTTNIDSPHIKGLHLSSFQLDYAFAYSLNRWRCNQIIILNLERFKNKRQK